MTTESLFAEPAEAQAPSITNDIKELQTAVTEFDAVRSGIANLRQKYRGVVFDVKTTKGMKEACEARQEIRAPRYAAQRVLNDAKRPLNDMKRNLQGYFDQIAGELLEIEAPIDTQIKAEEQRKADEKARKELEERQRIEAIQKRIEAIRRAAISASAPLVQAEGVREIIAGVEAEVIDDSLGEFKESAERAKAEALAALSDILQTKVAAEAEAKRVAEEEARLKAERERMAEERRKFEAEQAEFQRQQREAHERELARSQREAEERQVAEAAEVAANTPVQTEAPAPEVTSAPPPAVLTRQSPPCQPVASDYKADEARITLGQINAQLDPIYLTAAGLSKLGIEPAGRERNAVLYLESSMDVICAALIRHVDSVSKAST